MTDVIELKGLGAKTATWLVGVGIPTRQDLERVGPVDAYLAIQEAGHKVSLNLLWALQGALMDIHWNEVPTSIKDRLRAQLHEATSS